MSEHRLCGNDVAPRSTPPGSLLDARRVADERRRELWRVFHTYDPEQIAAVATVDEIEFAYAEGVIGPNVARKASELREEADRG